MCVDDCGAWAQHNGKKCYYLQDSFSQVELNKDGLFTRRRRVQGKLTPIVMDPQPTSVFCVHREYTKLARDSSYQRRITLL